MTTPLQSRAMALWLRDLPPERKRDVHARIYAAPGREWEALTPAEQAEALTTVDARAGP